MKNKINSARVNLVNLVNLKYNQDLEHELKSKTYNILCQGKPSKLGKPEIQIKSELQNVLYYHKPSQHRKPKIVVKICKTCKDINYQGKPSKLSKSDSKGMNLECANIIILCKPSKPSNKYTG